VNRPVGMLRETHVVRNHANRRATRVQLFEQVHHGFAFPQRWCYDKPAAERHWERLIALYRRRLG